MRFLALVVINLRRHRLRALIGVAGIGFGVAAMLTILSIVNGAIGMFEDGQPLFENNEPTELVKNILEFNQSFEEAGARTGAFMNEIKELDLLMDGEVTIQPDGAEQPFVYRGFRMVNEEKFRELRGDELRKMSQNGMLPLIMAHMFSLQLIREIFAKQVQQGKGPQIPAPVGNA